MSSLISQLKAVSQDMTELGAPWALVGALAVSIYGEPRTTRDIDLAVAISEEAHQKILVEKLQSRGYGNPQLLMHAMPTHRLGSRLQFQGKGEYPIALDLLFSSSGIEAEIVTNAVKIEIFPGIAVPIATRAHLIAMKVLSQNDTDRVRDKSDLQQLLHSASPDDLKAAQNALELMTMRSFNRNKNLQAELEDAVKAYAPELVKY